MNSYDTLLFFPPTGCKSGDGWLALLTSDTNYVRINGFEKSTRIIGKLFNPTKSLGC